MTNTGHDVLSVGQLSESRDRNRPNHTAKGRIIAEAEGQLARDRLDGGGHVFILWRRCDGKVSDRNSASDSDRVCRQLGLLFGVILLIAIRGGSVLQSAHPKLQIGRGVLAACSATLFIIGVSYVPLADAVAITFVAPFMVTVMGALILREPVGLRRWVAVSIGFLGVLIVIRPGMGVLHPAAGLIFIAAAAFALRQVLSRVLAGDDKTQTTVAYTAIVSSALLTIPLPFFWQTPSSALVIGLLIAMAVAAAIAETLVIMALDAAEAVVIAPVHYSLLIWGTLYGFFIFGQLPDGWTWLGALIIVASGLYTLNRERLAVRARR